MGRNLRRQLERSRKKQLRKQANIKQRFIFEEGDMSKMSLPMPTLWLSKKHNRKFIQFFVAPAVMLLFRKLSKQSIVMC